jgi:homocitrate synthase
MADVRPITIDDADSVIRAFHRAIKIGKDGPLLPDLTIGE